MLHCLMLDLNSLTCWCYECDEAFCPDLLRALDKEELCMADQQDTLGTEGARQQPAGLGLPAPHSHILYGAV